MKDCENCGREHDGEICKYCGYSYIYRGRGYPYDGFSIESEHLRLVGTFTAIDEIHDVAMIW